MYRADTIVACATAAGRGAIAIVRLSGPDCRAIARSIFTPHHARSLRPWRMCHGRIGGTDAIDDALAVYFPGPRTYTGEDMLEFHCHGSPLVVEQVMAAAVACGARAAERGEFSRRAVLNGRIDLVQAEAVADLIDSRLSAGARAAWDQLQGGLSASLADLRAGIVAVLADVEAHVDFSDDELPDESWPARRADLADVEAAIEAMLAGYVASRRQREGLRVVVVGRPNAGKSSLINRLLGTSRMIVTEEPGTTRDVVEEAVDLSGLAIVLTDTAGLRLTESPAETEAVVRARAALAEADIAVLVIDASCGLAREDLALAMNAGGARLVVALNKQDLGDRTGSPDLDVLRGQAFRTVATSAATGQGCDDLSRALVEAGGQLVESQSAGISRLRHRTALQAALSDLRRARASMENEAATEVATMELRAALQHVASITEAFDNEEVLDMIFRDFCIGK